jgi:hypothetical protein
MAEVKIPSDGRAEQESRTPPFKGSRNTDSGRGGRGRGGRRGTRGGRGRGRRGQRGTQSDGARSDSERLPTVAERAAQVARASRSAQEEKVTPAPSLSALNEALERAFPCDAVPVQAVQYVTIDTQGYQRLCREVYRQILMKDRHASDYLSEREFCLCMGWMLYRRIYEIHSKAVVAMIRGQDVLDAIPEGIEIPTPIAEYLAFIGVSRNANGQLIVPSLVVPSPGFNGARRGMEPTYMDNPNAVARVAVGTMFPYGLLWRQMIGQALNAGVNIDAWNAANVVRFDPANAHANDALLQTGWRISLLTQCDGESPRRQMTPNKYASFSNDGVLGSILYSADLCGDYVNFVSRVRKIIAFSPAPTSTAGSAVLSAWVVQQNAVLASPPTSFRYYSVHHLSKSEMYAIRLFHYRRSVFGAECIAAANADQDLLILRDPAALRPPGTLEISGLVGHQVYLAYYVRHFLTER